MKDEIKELKQMPVGHYNHQAIYKIIEAIEIISNWMETTEKKIENLDSRIKIITKWIDGEGV